MTRARISVLVLLAILALGGAALATGASAGGVATTNAVKSLSGCGANELPRQDDRPSSTATLGFTINFFGTNYTSLYVNNNGNVTFDTPLPQYTPENIVTTSHVIIAPFFADVDTRGAGSGVTTYGTTTFGGRPAFCVNWPHVGYFSSRDDKLNAFQLLIVDRSDIGPGDFDIIFNYDQIQWETGSASGGTNGLGGSSARAGYSNGSTTSFELPGSAVNGALLDSSPGGLANNSRGSLLNGRYVFEVRGGGAPTGGTISGHVYEGTRGGPPPVGPVPGALVQICRPGGTCNTTTTNALGEYSVSGLLAGQYSGLAFPPAGRASLFPGTIGSINLPSEGSLTGQDFFLEGSSAPPPSVVIQGITTGLSGVPVIGWGATQFTVANCLDGNGEWRLIKDDVAIASGTLSQTSPGVYKGTIPSVFPQRGSAVLRITIDCPSPTPDKNLDIGIYIDPSGTVVDQNGDPIAGATVTLYRSDSSAGPFEVVPDGDPVMSPSNRTNPDTTGADGVFHWDVFAGFYKVRAQAPGCVSPTNPAQGFVETEVLEIPPEAVGLELRLQCGGAPVNTPTRTPTGGGPTRTPTPPGSAQSGDVNKNGRVDSIDASIVLQYTAGLLNTINDTADVNENGRIDSIDATIILQFSAGLIHSLPV